MKITNMKRLFLFHWHRPEAEEKAEALRELGWDVDVEAEDGARGGSAVLNAQPDVVVVFLSRLPSHGRHMAAYLRMRPTGKKIPLIFVDGSGDPLEKTKALVPDALYISEVELPMALVNLMRRTKAAARKAEELVSEEKKL